MAELIVKYPDRAAERFEINRAKMTIGRSARNEICIPDPFASRVHAEIRSEGDQYYLQDLGSANGTLYNGSVAEGPIALARGGRIQIGETEILFSEDGWEPSPSLADQSPSVADQTTAGFLEPVWDDPLHLEGDNSDNGADRPLPGSVRLKPYSPQKPSKEDFRSVISAKAQEKYEVVIPLKPIFRFINEPIGPTTREHFVGRQAEVKALAEQLVFSNGGSFLVTGYRGVGKTSFVNEVIAHLKGILSNPENPPSNTHVLDIHFNLSRPLQSAELMHHIIRGVYQKLNDEHLLPLLETSVRDELTLAFYRTSMNVATKFSEGTERGFGLNEASIGLAQLNASLKTTLSYKKSRARNDELTFLAYDDKAAEQDIIRLSKTMASGYLQKQKKLLRLLNSVRGRPAERTPLKLVFVFDELDKLEDFTVSTGNKTTHVLDEILGSLKNVFTASGISFVFVAGKDLQERWLVDLGKGDSIYESIFAFDTYLPCMWSETAEICDRLVNWDQNVSENQKDSERSHLFFQHFKSYLAYEGRGIPRRIVRAFNKYVVWQDGQPNLAFTAQDTRVVRFYADLESVLRENHRSLFSRIQSDLADAQEDKRRLGIIYLVDWVLRQSIGKFSLPDAVKASKHLDAKIAFRDEVVQNIIKELFDVLITSDYLRHVQHPEDETLNGGTDSDLLQYELVPRRLAEIGSADAFEYGEKPADADPTTGSTLGHYYLARELAKGGMGHVFEGRDERNGQRVVLKMVASGFGQIKEVNERLKREAKILSKLNHPNVVKYYDCGEAKGRFFLVMEFIDGTDLGLMLRNVGQLEIGAAMAIVLPVARALQYIHSKRLVRIDVKPSNIVIEKTGHVYMIDFGTAKSRTPETETITQGGSFVGTPNYMSPEQLRGAPPDERSDIYALGIVLYETMVGKKPFVRELSDVMDTRIFQSPPAPSSFVSIPSELESLIMKCLETDPGKRFQTTDELVKELEECASRIPSAALAPIAETIGQKVTESEHFEAVRTNPSLVEPYDYEGPSPDISVGQLADARLLFVNGPRDMIPKGYPLSGNVSIGRSESNDLVLDDPKVSRFTARIEQESEEFWIEDLNPAHRTLVNSDPITGRTKLNDKDFIQIGDCVFEFRKSTVRRPTSRRSHRDANSDLLALISRVGVALLAPVTLNETLEQIVSLVFEAVPADRCLIMMREKDNRELKPAVARLRDRAGDVGEIRISRSMIDDVVKYGKSVLTSDAQADPRFKGGTVILTGVRSLMAAPLGVGENIFGFIYADSPDAEGRFAEHHLEMLTTLASVAAIRVENARLAEEQLERERRERELQVASEIQQRFQPTSAPQLAGYELQGINFPCDAIGGDYYDLIQRENGKLVVALGDVSGRGTAAALLMSSLHAAVHAQFDSHDSLVETISAVNRYLVESIPANRFITLFYGELDPADGSFSFVNAGHNPPIKVGAGGSVEQLATGGLPLGVLADTKFCEGHIQLTAGNVLVLYSDGVCETLNRRGEEFGLTRLCDVVARNVEGSAAVIRDRIESALTRFAEGTPQADDITLVILKRLANH